MQNIYFDYIASFRNFSLFITHQRFDKRGGGANPHSYIKKQEFERWFCYEKQQLFLFTCIMGCTLLYRR